MFAIFMSHLLLLNIFTLSTSCVMTNRQTPKTESLRLENKQNEFSALGILHFWHTHTHTSSIAFPTPTLFAVRVADEMLRTVAFLMNVVESRYLLQTRNILAIFFKSR